MNIQPQLSATEYRKRKKRRRKKKENKERKGIYRTEWKKKKWQLFGRIIVLAKGVWSIGDVVSGEDITIKWRVSQWNGKVGLRHYTVAGETGEECFASIHLAARIKWSPQNANYFLFQLILFFSSFQCLLHCVQSNAITEFRISIA